MNCLNFAALSWRSYASRRHGGGRCHELIVVVLVVCEPLPELPTVLRAPLAVVSIRWGFITGGAYNYEKGTARDCEAKGSPRGPVNILDDLDMEARTER